MIVDVVSINQSNYQPSSQRTKETTIVPMLVGIVRMISIISVSTATVRNLAYPLDVTIVTRLHFVFYLTAVTGPIDLPILKLAHIPSAQVKGRGALQSAGVFHLLLRGERSHCRETLDL